MDQDSGPLRALYVGAVTGTRRLLDGSRLLAAWDRTALDAPRSRLAHARTLLALHRPEDLVMLDLPWWTYDAVDRVDSFLGSLGGGARVLEFGSGASTVWLARRAAAVHSVEHDHAWAERVRSLLSRTPDLACRPHVHVPAVARSDHPVVASGAPSGRRLDFEAYVELPSTLDMKFDLVLVDGRAREESLVRTLRFVEPGGVVLLDDSQRPRYQRALVEAAAHGWQAERLRGATPCQPLPRETTILTRRGSNGG